MIQNLMNIQHKLMLKWSARVIICVILKFKVNINIKYKIQHC